MSFSMGDKQMEIIKFKVAPVLARRLSWLEHCFIHQVPHIKRSWFDPWKGLVREAINQCFSYPCMSACLSLFLLPSLPSCLPSSLSKNQWTDYLVRILKVIANYLQNYELSRQILVDKASECLRHIIRRERREENKRFRECDMNL